ncbi:PDR/VanB family oxidoreductase [Burkholderia anthina]|uniref:PDR/VanB family oxidoreductase n=1 Tax=Burkholderia anthina TaxID=179879 RepID=UPI001CF1F0C5|nr:PDR/VanB family oxidoreductase [Burkholderia anthina]MCA8095382.1 PDR/VanB family oxidoreductase [Burkholderia anthina]
MKYVQAVYVTRVEQVCDDVRLIELDFGAPLAFEPGSHVDVLCQLESGTQSRSYSLIGTQNGGSKGLIAVRRVEASRGGSAFMWRLREGDALRIDGPHNAFPLSTHAVPRILVAGGIGITPIVGMVEQLLAARAEFRLVYAGRNRKSMPFLNQLEKRLGRAIEIYDASLDEVVSFESLLDGLDRDAEMYVCGPVGMLTAARNAWVADGRRSADLRFESFANGGAYPNRPFTLKVPRLGIEVGVGANETVLDALEAAGADPLFNCRKGECGLCAVRVVQSTGEIDHRDVFLSDEQKRAGVKMCACVSRVNGGSLTVDLP